MTSFLHNIVGKMGISLLCITVSLYANDASSQHLSFKAGNARWEAGVNFGPTFFLGDLGGNAGKGTRFVKDLNLELTKLMKGGFVAFYPADWIGFRAAAQYTYVEGRDNIINTNGVNELWRKQRNLDFKSDIWEVYGAVEIFPTMMRSDMEDYDPRIRPYGFIGVGMFRFNPKGSITDANGNKTWHELHPLRTEGQGMAEYPDKKTYSLTQMNIPMGGGIRVKMSDRVNTSFELLYRKTFTDHIDDVSTTYIDPNLFDIYLTPQQARIAREIHDKTVGIVTPGVNRYEPGTQRGNSKQMDAYFSFAIKIGVTLGEVFSSDPRKNALQKTRCPHFF